MRLQEIKLLKKQMNKLDTSDFDLEAWKTGATIILERIFGPGNQKISQIEKIKYDQSSWALREAKGSKNMMETCKKQGREILGIAIDELEHFGLPEEIEEAQAAPFKSTIVQALENELKISEYREVIRIIDSDKKNTEKRKELIETLNDYGHDIIENILTSILLSDQTKKYL
ncbi:MAG: hypothetical protein MI975_17290 [Cytophagales bacterium]|nr:hypothetical protein [Cytophagales bacterium]